MKNFFDKLELLIDDLFYETKETVKNKEFYFLRENSKIQETGASLETMLDVAHCLDRSASFVLGLDDFPDSYEQDLNCKI